MKLRFNNKTLELNLLDKDSNIDEINLSLGLREVNISYPDFFECLNSLFQFKWFEYPTKQPEWFDECLVYNHIQERDTDCFIAVFNGLIWHIKSNPDIEIKITHFVPIKKPKIDEIYLPKEKLTVEKVEKNS